MIELTKKQNWMHIGLTALAIAAALVSTPNHAAAQAPLVAQADVARTSAEHAKVARAFRVQADELQAKADELESHASELARQQGPTTVKWPALSSREYQQAKQQAAEARRGARQNRELAEQHLRQSLEALGNN